MEGKRRDDAGVGEGSADDDHPEPLVPTMARALGVVVLEGEARVPLTWDARVPYSKVPAMRSSQLWSFRGSQWSPSPADALLRRWR
jgi:hypothetical protein